MRQQGIISRVYCLVFLTLEPLFALGGAYLTYFTPSDYLNSLYPYAPFNFLPKTLPPSVTIAMTQLSSCYLHFAFSEVVVLRFAAQKHPRHTTFDTVLGMEWRIIDTKIWRAMVIGMLVSDVGHLWSVRSLGAKAYYDFAGWNQASAMLITYAFVLARLCFLAGVGVKKLQQHEDSFNKAE